MSKAQLCWATLVLMLVPVLAPGPRRRSSSVLRWITTLLQFSMLGIALGFIVSRDAATEFAASSRQLAVAVTACAVLGILKLWTAVEFMTWVAVSRPGANQLVVGALTALLAIVAAGVPLVAAVAFTETRSTLSVVFAGDPDDGPVATPGTLPSESVAPGETPDPDQPVESTVPQTGSGLAGPDGRWNVLLLGVDSGAGRQTRLTDAMLIVSVDPNTGDLAVVSVPRDSLSTPMPAGSLRDEYPNGFDGKTNAIYNYGYRHPEVNPDIEDPVERGAWMISSGLAELTGLRVDDWVMVDMAGFVDVVDAVGPIDVWVDKRVPLPGSPPDAKHPTPAYFDVGWHSFDGTDALAYSRSRHGDSDFYRIARQRCVLAATAARMTPANLVTSWLPLLDAVEQSTRTSIAQESLPEMKDLMGRLDLAAARAVSLAPPEFDPYQPDLVAARQIVAATVNAAPPAAEVATSLPGPVGTSDQPVDTTVPTTTEPTTIEPTTTEPDVPFSLVSTSCSPPA